jgi:predicted nucleotidyltransferase
MSLSAIESSELSELAEASTEILRSDPRCQGVLLFGSAARRDENENSDLDLLVLYRDEVPEETLDRLAERVSVSFYDEARLRALPSRSPLFAVHLAHEGRALYDPRGKLRETLGAVGPLTGGNAAAVAALTRKRLARVLADPEYAPADALSAGQLYALAKQSALLTSALHGEYEFDRKRAFRALADSQRSLRADLERVALLEPAWLSVRPTFELASFDREALDEEVASAAVRVIDHLVNVGA